MQKRRTAPALNKPSISGHGGPSRILDTFPDVDDFSDEARLLTGPRRFENRTGASLGTEKTRDGSTVVSGTQPLGVRHEEDDHVAKGLGSV